MISCSVNSGIISRSGIREKLNKDYFQNTNLIMSSVNLISCTGAPQNGDNIILRHLYRYNRTSNSFTFLGCQRGQSVSRSLINISIDNTNITNLNNNKMYSSVDSDINISQDNIDSINFYLTNFFLRRNLYDGQVIFIDTSWVIFYDGNRRDIFNLQTFPEKKGNPYRIGAISNSDLNIVEQMSYKQIFSNTSISANLSNPARTTILNNLTITS